MVVVFRQKWFYSGKYGCIRAKVVVFRQIGCIRAMWLYSGRVVVFGQNLFLSAKVVAFRINVAVFGKIGCIR